MRAALETEGSYQGEMINYRRTGEPYVMDWAIAAVRDARGMITGWRSVQDDVTADRRQALARSVAKAGRGWRRQPTKARSIT